MKIKNILLVIAFSIGLVSLNAQKSSEERGFDVAQFKEKQAEFLKQELSLTDAEAKAFIPLVNEFTDKKFELNRAARTEARALRQSGSKSEADYNKALENYLNTREQEVKLEKEYYQKFKNVLPAEKVFKYQRAEKKFMQRAVENYRSNRESGRK